MKVFFKRKDVFSYLFILLLSITCIIIGITALTNGHMAIGPFSIILGLILLAIGISMLFRKY